MFESSRVSAAQPNNEDVSISPSRYSSPDFFSEYGDGETLRKKEQVIALSDRKDDLHFAVAKETSVLN